VTILDIEEEAKKVLVALGMWRLPVNPLAIAKEEGIELAPGRYSEKFDARIKFVRSAKTFILSYREPCDGLTVGRVRFSVGHELGHFYLPHHRDPLVRGETHNSVTDFRSRHPREMEADEFSSALLMPHALFAAELKKRSLKICTLQDLSGLAETSFHTSLTSTVRRYVGFDWEPCIMLVSEGGAVKWFRASDSMRALGMGFVAPGTPAPNASPTARLWSRLEQEKTLDREENEVDAEIWFDRPFTSRLWEESIPLGYTGLVLTFLTAEDSDDDD
jgi:IrrE N-terminal-like domain